MASKYFSKNASSAKSNNPLKRPTKSGKSSCGNTAVKNEIGESESINVKLEVKAAENADPVDEDSKRNVKKETADSKSVKKKKSPVPIEYEPAKKAKSVAWEPEYWRQQLTNIREMRKAMDAPVDTMGCEKISDENATPAEYRYQVLLSLMLSSQTKDQITSEAMAKIRSHGCNVDNILKTDNKKLQELIYPVGFYKRKVEFIKKTSLILKNEYDNDIPSTVEKLCKLPGVGSKMAHLVMKVAWKENTGIGVDVHVHRIANRLKWVGKGTEKPEQTESELQSWVPRELWPDVNWLLVGFGQQVCLPVKPKCGECLNKGICPVGKKTK